MISLKRNEDVVCLTNYKEEKLNHSIHTLYTKKLIEGIEAIQEMEKILYETENDYGSKILKNIWKSLPTNERIELECHFDILIGKIRNCKNKTIPPANYKPSL